VVLMTVIGILLNKGGRHCKSEVITICVGTLLLWYIVFPVQMYGYVYYKPKHLHLDVRLLRRLRRKARRQIKDLKKTGTLHLMYRTYDGKLHVVGSRSCEMDFSKNVESFRREWILQEVKNIRKKIHIGAHIGPMG